MKAGSDNLKETELANFDIENNSSSNIKNDLVNILESKGAEEINVIDLHGKSDIADYLIICTGSSTVNVSALAEYSSKYFKERKIEVNIEGRPHNNWVIVDSASVVVHIFRQEIRELYQLDKMWGDIKPSSQ